MDWKARIERALGDSLKSVTPVTGGTTFRVLTRGAKNYFAKIQPATTTRFIEEAKGLAALTSADAIAVPKVFFADDHILLMDWIESETPGPEFWQRFGCEMARLHSRPADHYGFVTDNHIGGTPQANPRRSVREISWTEYFLEFRLQPLLHAPALVADALLQATYRKNLGRVRMHLDQVKEEPCLVHGDLWNGNFLCGPDQVPYLIDPAPYWGHREVDLAMSELFGGFAPDFYARYRRDFRLTDGYEARRPIYNLYHLMNHWILFGESYRGQTLRALKELEELR